MKKYKTLTSLKGYPGHYLATWFDAKANRFVHCQFYDYPKREIINKLRANGVIVPTKGVDYGL